MLRQQRPCNLTLSRAAPCINRIRALECRCKPGIQRGACCRSLQPRAEFFERRWSIRLAHLNMIASAIVTSAQLLCSAPAEAVLNSPNAQIPRTVDAALRRSIPAFNPTVAEVQSSMEDVAYFLRIPQRKPWADMSDRISKALNLLGTPELLVGVPSGKDSEAQDILKNMRTRLKELQLAVQTQQPDAVSIRVAAVLKGVSELELLQAPGLPYILPKEYSNLPRLTGRAVVELKVEKDDGTAAFVDDQQGGLKKQGIIRLTLDGYSSPISSGNFLINVMEGLYNQRAVLANSNSVIIGGPATTAKPPIPLEILPAGEFDPVYRIPLDVQGGELPVLPLSINGAVSMARVERTDSFLSGDQWFIYKFDRQQGGLSGLSFDEGTFGVFGYVTAGLDVVNSLKSGDVIVSAKVVSGADKLVRPTAPELTGN